MQLQEMSPMDRRGSSLRDAAAGARGSAAASSLQALGFWVQGRTEPFKISEPKAHHLNHIVRKLSSKENHKSRFFMTSSSTRDEPGEPAKKCASPLSLAIDQEAANAISCRPSEGSCVISPSPRSFSDCSGLPGCSFVGQRVNLELSLSICGSQFR
ncbi:hypothetical protein ABZP36_023171 [Zizania latifolia]